MISLTVHSYLPDSPFNSQSPPPPALLATQPLHQVKGAVAPYSAIEECSLICQLLTVKDQSLTVRRVAHHLLDFSLEKRGIVKKR